MILSTTKKCNRIMPFLRKGSCAIANIQRDNRSVSNLPSLTRPLHYNTFPGVRIPGFEAVLHRADFSTSAQPKDEEDAGAGGRMEKNSSMTQLSAEDAKSIFDRAEKIASWAAIKSNSWLQNTNEILIPAKSPRLEIDSYVKDTLDTAEELLILTSNPNFGEVLLMHNVPKNGMRATNESPQSLVIVSLHRSFIAVSKRLLQLSSSFGKMNPNDQKQILSLKRVLETSLELFQRAERLNIPVHIPLYQQLALSCATYLQTPFTTILEISLSLKRSMRLGENNLASKFWEDFISASLFQMAQQKKYGDMKDLIHAMSRVHGYELGPDIAARIISSNDEFYDDMAVADDSDAIDLALLLQEPMVDALKKRKIMVQQTLNAFNEKVDGLVQSMDDSDSDEEYYDGEDSDGEDAETEGDKDIFTVLNELDEISASFDDEDWDNLHSTLATLDSSLVKHQNNSNTKLEPYGCSLGSDNEKNVTAPKLAPQMVETSSTDLPVSVTSVPAASKPSEKKSAAVLYLSDRHHWNIPDVWPQVLDLSDGKDIILDDYYEDVFEEDMEDFLK